MRYLTKDWFILCQTYPMPDELKKKMEGAVASCREAQNRERLPDKLREDFMFHDGEVLGISAGTDLTIRIKSPYSNHHKITFLDAAVKQELPPVGATWLCEELYRHKSGVGYEAHILFQKVPKMERKISAAHLFDAKIICKDILFE